MKQSARASAHTTLLKIRLPETLRHQLLIHATGRPFNHVIVDRLEAGSSFSDVNLARVGSPMRADVYDAAVKALTVQQWRLAQDFRDLNVAIRVTLKVGMMLAPESPLLRSVRPRSDAHRFLKSARDKIRGALDIVLRLYQEMVDFVAPPLVPPSPFSFHLPAEPPQHATETIDEQSDRPQEAPDPGNIVEVKIRLSDELRDQLAAEAARNKRTLTAEIRARLELNCAVEIVKRRIGQEMAEIVIAAAENAWSLRPWRIELTTDNLDTVIDALETAQAVLNPLSGYLIRVRSTSNAARELEDTRKQIRTALVVVQRLPEAMVKADHRPTSQRH
jgi:hypothetical protein